MPTINDPAVVAEVTAVFEAYECALVGNDIEALTGFFWDSPHAIRFGIGEQLYGAAAIAEFRKNRVINFSERKPVRLEVTALGHDVAITMYEYSVVVAGQTKHGRQTQVFARFPDAGWRIVAAHVSNALSFPGAASAATSASPWEAYADRAAAAIGLPIAPAHRLGVIANLERAAAIAAPLLAFALPDDVEPAGVFSA